MSVERQVRSALWKVVAVKAVRELTLGVQEICLSVGKTVEGLCDCLWMLECDQGRRYEALTGIDLNKLAGGEEGAYRGESEVISSPDEDEL